MGNTLTSVWETYWHPELNPVAYGPTTFDPEIGIGKRKERVMIATEEELRAAKIDKSLWDYCAHTYLEVERCRFDNFPFLWRCRDQITTANECIYQDYLLRMKEYERERRLIQRKAKEEAVAA